MGNCPDTDIDPNVIRDKWFGNLSVTLFVGSF